MSSASNLDTSSRYRLTGANLYSGLDTDSIIKALVSNTQSRIDKQEQLEQIAEWKRDLYRDVASDMSDFEDTYFSYTSDSNLMSSSFFKSSTISSSSDLVSATGDTSSLSSLIINSISQMATKTSYASSQKASDEVITSDAIQTDWTQSSVGGKSMIVSYNGTNYTLTLSHSVKLDSNNMSDGTGLNTELQKVVDGLNEQIEGKDDLKGKVEFVLNSSDHSISLKSNTDYDVGIKAYKTKHDPTTGPAFLDALGLTADSTGTKDSPIKGDSIQADDLLSKTVSSSSYLNFKIDGEEYTVNLGNSITVNSSDDNLYVSAIAKQLQDQIDNNDELKDKLAVTANAGKISFTSSDGNLSVTGGSQNLIQGLGIPTSDTPSSTSVEGAGVDASALLKSYLGDTLAGSTLTVSLDGVSKTISFDADEEASYSDASGLANYLQDKLNDAFGAGKTSVSYDSGTGKLSFSAGENSILTFSSSSSSNVLDQVGALRLTSGASNRLHLTDTLDELSGELGLTPNIITGDDGKPVNQYTIDLNGKELTFDGDTTLSSVISQINGDSEMGVTVTYSQTTDKFRITADETGSQGKIYYSDTAGNLTEKLFGTMSSGSFSDIQSAQLTTGGSITIDEDSSYSFTYGDTQKVITVGAGTYSTLDDLKSDLQTQLDSAFGSGTVTVNSDTGSGTLSFAAGTNQLSITSQSTTEALGISSASNLNGYTAGQDLKMDVSIDGKSMNLIRSSNTVPIDNVNLTVNGTTGENDGPITFSADSNVDDLASKIVDFINDYNKIVDKVNTLTSEAQERDSDHKIRYSPLTEAQKDEMTDDEIEKWNDKAKQGLLQNDSTLNGILRDLRSAMRDTVESAGFSLSDLGISTKAYDYTSGGQLVVDTDKLKDTLTKNPDAVTKMFTDEDGISQRVKASLDKYVGTFGGDGILLQVAGSKTDPNDTSQLTLQINQYGDTISRLKVQLQTEENRYWNKFTAMEQSLSTLTAQSDYLASMSGSGS